MARRRKGRPITGWMVIDKPAGITSSAVVNKVRWALEAQKAGHAGTLDPDATGLLVVALGEATKALSALTDALKTYEFTVNWGAATSTDDASGEVLEQCEARPSEADVRAMLPDFTGDIMQVPPQVSAVKVDGQRAYDLAREGEVMELAARPLFVETLELVSASRDQVTLRMTCGKGGYVRSIARDMGAALGCLGHVQHLRRVETGHWTEADAVPFSRIEELERTPALDALVRPLVDGLAILPECRCSTAGGHALRHGNPGEMLECQAGTGELAFASVDGAPVAIGEAVAGQFHPKRVFVFADT
ncbi:tRNA pseudouridine(55) synthase TruB [Algicella marina]|uniref:tRNA pseudouridine synthase B n=1 Tax=Algicella marina TaxID=2683284 RepID=A0A6P1SWY8_9RHOB|nr:tRNA pseudouridine(55) synthase TruB [Algicella marina]QHQ33726.1 tRNA pseudouridine(55) synthase TruB [Algicella marina]